MAPPPPPPPWLFDALKMLALVSVCMMLMFLSNMIECSKYIRFVLSCQVILLVLVLVAQWQPEAP